VKLKSRIQLLIANVACLLLLLLGTLPALWAQQTTGAVTGLVLDPSGSAVADATVLVRDVQRGTTWTTKSTATGLYNFPTIPVGTIEVKVEANGFASQARSAFTLVLNQIARVDFHLTVGKVSETVTVNDEPPLLQSSSTELGTLIDANAAENLPLATRDINQLTLLAPGVLTSNVFAFESPQTTFGTGRPYVNGAREQDNNFLLDGMDVNQPDNDEVAYTPSPDAIQEFNIIVSNAAADYGNYAGGVIVESIKSGTNQFHGNLFEFLRNDDFNANTWQNKANNFIFDGSGARIGSTLPRQEVRWNEFGGTIGGPIRKDKLFFFFDEETSLYYTKTAQTNGIVPDNNFLTATQGKSASQVYDLGYFCTASGGAFDNTGICKGGQQGAGQLYMPASGVTQSARALIPYNQIPVTSVNSVSKALLGLPEFVNEMTNLNYYQGSTTHDFQGDIKIDWQASSNDHVMGRYSQMYTHAIQDNGSDLLQPQMEREYPLKNIVINYDRTITPTLVNEFRIGTQIFPANDQFFTGKTSYNPNNSIGLQGVPGSVLPQISMGYGPGGQVGNSNNPEIFHDTTMQYEDTLTWTHGKHSIHTGFQFLHYDMNDVYGGNNGEAGAWTFTGQYTGGLAVGVSSPTVLQGSAWADFLLGLPQQVAVGERFPFHLTNSLFGAFLQDNYQVTPDLTLNLGLRYEVVTPRGDRNAQNNVNFDKVTGMPHIGMNYNTYYGIGDLEPRFGFAWKPSFAPNTVLRGAYDISSFMEGVGIGNMAVINPPYTVDVDQTNSSGSNLLYPQYTFSNGYTPYQSPCTAAELISAGSTGTPSPCLTGLRTHATDPNLRPAMNQQWNLTIQHQFKNNLTASVGYVGNKDDHMSDIYWYNQKMLTTGTQVVNGVTVPAVTNGPFMQNLVNAGVAQARYNGSDAISRYEALELTLAQKNFHGLDLQANYTWSKCLSNSLGYFGSYGDEEGIGEQQNEAGGNFFQNEYNPKGDYGKCSIDAASAFNAYALYALPFGRGKLIGGGVSKAVDEVIGGWNLSVDTTFRSGFAVTPYAGEWFGSFNALSASNLTAPSYVPRADCASNATFGQHMQFAQIGSSVGMTNLNPGALQDQANGQFGNCGVGAMRGPSLKTADMNLTKSFPVTDKIHMTVMAQFVNLTNTPIFSIPNTWDDNYSSCEYCTGVRTTGYNGGGAGTVGVYGLLDGSNPGRQIELSAKISF
jgi:hypothetical protein